MNLGHVKKIHRYSIAKDRVNTLVKKLIPSKPHLEFNRARILKTGAIMLALLFAASFSFKVLNDTFHNINSYIVSAEGLKDFDINSIRIEQQSEVNIIYDNEFFTNENVIFKDKRAYVLDKYFEKFNSPLVGLGIKFVEACEKYGAPKDCLVVAAIAQNESLFCTYPGSAEMHNCWGYGGPGIHRWRFDSFEAGINQVTDILVNRYGVEYMEDPRKMQRTFCGAEPACEYWGGNILSIMEAMNRFAIELGVGSLR